MGLSSLRVCVLLDKNRNAEGDDGEQRLIAAISRDLTLFPSSFNVFFRFSSYTFPFNALQLMAEIRIHRSLSHKSIVRFESYFEDAVNVYIMLEMCGSHVSCLI